MAKVKSLIMEGEVTLMKDLDIEFVSLVDHAANQQPFKIIKGQVKGDKNMNKVIHSILVPKNIGEEKLSELKETYSVDEKAEDSLEEFDVYKQVKDEDVDLETKALAAVDKESNIYCIVADKQEESKVEPTEKEVDYATMDSLGDAAMAMLDVVFGTLRQPEGTPAQRRNTVLSAVDNFRKYSEAVLSNSKSEDVISMENIEVKGENLKELMTSEPAEPDTNDFSEKIDELKNTLISKLEEKTDEKSQAKIDEFKQEFETMKTQLNDSLNEKFESLASKEDVDGKFSELKTEIDEIKNTSNRRKSEIDEHVEPEEKKSQRKKSGYITFV